MPDVYISADIEADGPIPGCYSMLSFGFAVAGRFDGATFEAFEPEAKTFSRELRPISDEAHTAALAVSGLDRERLRHEGADAAEAMRAAAAWVAMQSEGVIGDDVLLSRRPPETTSESRPPLSAAAS